VIEQETNRPFSLTRGGWFYQLLHRVRLINRHGHVRWLWLAGFLWVPMMLAALVRWLSGEALDAVVGDPSVHVRVLLSLPLVLLASHLLEQRCAQVAQLIRYERLTERTNIEAILGRAEHVAGSRIAESVFAVAAIIGGQASLWGLMAPSGIIHASERDTGSSFATFWFATVAIPLLQFLVLRFLWHWAVWSYVLVRFSRLRLATNALHPDRAAGLRFLSNPVDAFAIFISANLFAASSAWIVKIQLGHATVESFGPMFVGFFLIAVVAACGPLLMFTPQIYQARYQDVERYDALAYEYVRDFRRKWIINRTESVPRSQHTLLGTGDIQSLNDLGGSFTTAANTRPVAFNTRTLIVLALCSFAPALPLVFASMPTSEVLRHIGKMLQLPLT
jgi:hypothetical protein